MVGTLRSLNDLIHEMPIYGKLREENEALTFGQYLTVLHAWFKNVERELAHVDKEAKAWIGILS